MEKAFRHIYTVSGDIGRSMAAPPGVPTDRMAAWRGAFQKMLADPAFKADIAKRNITLNPPDAAGLKTIVDGVMATPAGTVEIARGFYAKVLPAVLQK